MSSKIRITVKYWSISLSLLVSALIIIVYNYSISTKIVSDINQRSTKYILYWMKMFGDSGFHLGLGSDIFENCTYTNCFATDNKSLLQLHEFSAILFHAPEHKYERIGDRSTNQVYVFSNQESPLNTPMWMEYPAGYFNWTMTYRTDSDVLRAYGYVVSRSTDYEPPTIQEIRSRPRRIAWFVSNCMTQSRREHLAQELDKYYPVDIYGRCGKLYCAKKRHKECLNMVESDYKYYFSAENSLCVDYITEKLFDILVKNVVPLVYGGARYDKLAPPHSVIDVSHFQTVEELSNYLHYLDENPSEYLKYFEWKKNYVIDDTSQVTVCSLCEKLHKSEYKKYDDISTWWFGDNLSMCQYGDQLPEIVKSAINYSLYT